MAHTDTKLKPPIGDLMNKGNRLSIISYLPEVDGHDAGAKFYFVSDESQSLTTLRSPQARTVYPRKTALFDFYCKLDRRLASSWHRRQT